ncbi:MAG: HAD family phosphatase [Lentisphaeria bacterium]|nr:HAD family phosphatase [Lentisphaeria bacterium]
MISQKYAIFDMDGTLVDSMQYWRNILSEYLQMPVSKEYAEKIAAMTITESITLTIQEFKLKKSSRVIFDEISEIMYHHYINDIPLKAGVAEYLHKLRQNDVRMCIASASPVTLIWAVAAHHKITDNFEFFCSTEDGFPDKREPDIFLYCAAKFGAEPQESTVFEDSFSAIKSAKKANFNVVAVYDDTQKEYWDEIIKTADRYKISFL